MDHDTTLDTEPDRDTPDVQPPALAFDPAGQTSPAIFGAFPKAMRTVGAVGKNRRADPKMGGYAFRGIDDLYDALNKPLSDAGLFYIPWLERVEEATYKSGGSNREMRLVSVIVRYTFYASDGSSVTARVPGEAADVGDKAMNKAMTAALKYLLFHVFCIPVSDHDDADAATEPLTTGATAAVVAVERDAAEWESLFARLPADRRSQIEQIADERLGHAPFGTLSDQSRAGWLTWLRGQVDKHTAPAVNGRDSAASGDDGKPEPAAASSQPADADPQPAGDTDADRRSRLDYRLQMIPTDRRDAWIQRVADELDTDDWTTLAGSELLTAMRWLAD